MEIGSQNQTNTNMSQNPEILQPQDNSTEEDIYIHAPFEQWQIESLSEWQKYGGRYASSCLSCYDGKRDSVIFEIKKEGYVCPSCGYTHPDASKTLLDISNLRFAFDYDQKERMSKLVYWSIKLFLLPHWIVNFLVLMAVGLMAHFRNGGGLGVEGGTGINKGILNDAMVLFTKMYARWSIINPKLYALQLYGIPVLIWSSILLKVSHLW